MISVKLTLNKRETKAIEEDKKDRRNTSAFFSANKTSKQ